MLQYAFLWLLSEHPDYGYHLRKRFEARLGPSWPLNIGQVYQTLQRLERDGLVVPVADGTPEGPTTRRLMALTPKGRLTLQRWLHSSEFDPRPRRDESLLRVLLLEDGAHPETLAQLAEQERRCRRYLERLEHVAAGGSPRPLGHRLGLEAERLRTEAQLRWLVYCREQLAQGTTPEVAARTSA